MGCKNPFIKKLIMKKQIEQVAHNITYEGLELEVLVEFEEADNTTGYKGGWSTLDITINGHSLYWFLKPEIIEHISELILNENY